MEYAACACASSLFSSMSTSATSASLERRLAVIPDALAPVAPATARRRAAVNFLAVRSLTPE